MSPFKVLRRALVVVCVIVALVLGGVYLRTMVGGQRSTVSSGTDIRALTAVARLPWRASSCSHPPHLRRISGTDDPIVQPPNPKAVLVTRAQAVAIARGTKNGCAPTMAFLVTEGGLGKIVPEAGNNGYDPRRKVWIVAVHGDTLSRGNVETAPQLVHVYSVVIDAESGGPTGVCYGCAWVR